MSSQRLGRVFSDLSHRVTTDHGLHRHQRETTTTSNNEGGNVGKATKQRRLSLLIPSVVAWTRSERSGETSCMEKNGRSKPQQANDGGTSGRRRRGLDEIVLAVRKYVAMLEQLFVTSSFYSGSSSISSSRRRSTSDRPRRDGRRSHTFTFGRHAAGVSANAAAQAQSSSSKRHSRGRLSSAPASLRGSPATSGHLSVGESVTKASSEVSTMEELQSAIQAAIAHCKNSAAAAVAGGDKQQQQRKC